MCQLIICASAGGLPGSHILSRLALHLEAGRGLNLQ